MKRIMATIGLLLLMAGQALAEEHLVMRFDFENVDGKNVTDPVSGITAKVMNQASVVDMGSRKVLDLGNGSGYLDMTKGAGEVVRNLSDFTVSVYYRIDGKASLSGAGYFLWCFSQSAANTQTSSPYTAYRLNAQRIATSTGGWGNEVGIELSSESAKGRWIHLLYRQSGQKGELFLDGKCVAQATNMPVLKNTFSNAPAYNWIGRAPFSGDNYLKQTLVSDFRLYDVAVSDATITALTAETKLLDKDYNYGVPGNFSTLQTTVNEVRSFIGEATSGYAPNAIAELHDEMVVAEYEIASGRASQTLIDEYVSTLKSLLTKAKSTKNYVPKNIFTQTEDHGFVHPGGIVSQADIDRAKQLLADGDVRIKKAWNILCNNEYAQSGVQTYPVETIVRGGSSGQNYINVARGAAMAYQNALRWKIGGTRANADAAVRILMAWAKENKLVSGDSNVSLAAGLYGYQLANAAELMRDYDGWKREDFETFRQYMIKTWYSPAIDFLRRRHNTWLNSANSGKGQRPGHYWSNWGLCNALCVMSIGILCDDVHMYNQGVSFYKYDHVGTYTDRSKKSSIQNDGCTEFIGNLVPVVLPDERGPLGYLGQMQESGRDQGHAQMALGLAIDICQVGLNQGDDLFAYMDDRIAAGIEHVAAFNFGGVDGKDLPWITYNYADCRTSWSAPWVQEGPNEGGKTEARPYWDRAIGYYEGMRGIKLQYAEQASAKICPDGGGGNYGQNSGGFDHLGFSTLTGWRPAIDASEGITPLSGDILYRGVTYKNQTNLGGLKYNYEVCPSKAIPADGSDITLIPQLPEGVEDSGNWIWSTGETTRQITVKADHSYIYRVAYTAQNGAVSHQSFAIAVSGDANPDVMTEEITVDGVIDHVTEKTVLAGTNVILSAGSATGWTDDYLWDNGVKASMVSIPAITSSRTYLCQYANQSGAVSESRFNIHVVDAQQFINGVLTDEAEFLPNSRAELRLNIPSYASASDISWEGGTTGETFIIDNLTEDTEVTATYNGTEYHFVLRLMGDGSYPIDATSLIINPDFATIDDTGWNMTGTWGNQRFNGAVEVWHSIGFESSQTISGLPDGEYTISCQLVNGEGSNTGYIYATSGDKTSKATVKQSCAGSDFNAQRDKMAANAAYGRVSVTVNVVGGTLTIGIKDTSSGTNWLVWDNFTLTFNKGQYTGIDNVATSQTATRQCIDLHGRQVQHTPKCGIYIIDGKKVIVK